MAIYSTFFACVPDLLPSGFTGWKPPLPAPVQRDVKDFLTGKTITIETREPEWENEDSDDDETSSFGVTSIEGDYEDYLEERLPAFVAGQLHWCAKDFTEVELNPLGQAAGFDSAVDDALYGPPSAGGIIQRFRPELVSKLVSLDKHGLAVIAEKWAKLLSGPEHTHSVSGTKVQEGCEFSETSAILDAILQLVRNRADAPGLYVLIEW